MPLVQTRGAASAQGFGEFAQAAVAANYIEDMFSTFLYTGNGSTQTITNGIDLSGKGGLVWIKVRDHTLARNHILTDTVRGNQYPIFSDLTAGQVFDSDTLSSFSSTGFSVGNSGSTNQSGRNIVSWTFREQPKFFDIVTYTGTGSNTTIAHSLGSVPGSIIVKRTDTTADWAVYHRSLANTQYLVLNTSAAVATGATWWNSTTPTSSVFSLGTDASVNASGGTYVAYVFAHDAGGFGLTGTDNVISCGSVTADGSGGCTVNLGYEPQWIMYKMANRVTPWTITDNMRGWSPQTTVNPRLYANASDAETTSNDQGILSTGFNSLNNFSAGDEVIYIAIRRGPMKVPTVGTSVFVPAARTGTGAATTITSAGFPVDLVIGNSRNAVSYGAVGAFGDRLRGKQNLLYSEVTNAEDTANVSITGFDVQNGISVGGNDAYSFNQSGGLYVNWFMRRAPSFVDVVCYTGTGSATTFSHNLGVVPELMIVKRRNTANAWAVYANNDNTDYLVLNTTAATADDNTYWNDTSPTSSVFSVGTNNAVNASASTYVAYLFATCAGVSKVGSYTGTGTTLQINCGFTAGARFVLIKRTDSTGDWYVWDSARGIVAGNDPYLLLNSTAAEVTGTDYIDTYSAGFEISSTAPAAINASAGSFIFLAIA